MKQEIKIQEPTEESIKRIISDRFLNTMNQTIESGLVKNEREFILKINGKQDNLSHIKKKDGKRKRYVDAEMMYNAVNLLGLNANHFLADGGEKTEPLQRESVQINGGTVNGNHNVVLTGQAVSQNGDVYFQVKKLIQGLADKDKKLILDEIGSVNTDLNNQIEALKKTLDQCERELAKDKLLMQQYVREIEKDQKIINLYEKQQEADKKTIADQEKRIKDLEQSSSKKKSR